VWTPCVVIADSAGHERWRIEGYLPHDEFRTALEMGLARIKVMSKRWTDAETLYKQIYERDPNGWHAAEALYWQNVSHYSATKDHTALSKVAEELKQRFPGNEWTEKASVWLG